MRQGSGIYEQETGARDWLASGGGGRQVLRERAKGDLTTGSGRRGGDRREILSGRCGRPITFDKGPTTKA